MMALIRTHKEKKLNKCLHRLFPLTEMVEKPIEHWVVFFFRMLAEQNTFLLSPLPSLIANNTLFKSFTQNVVFPRHLHTLTTEAIYEYETHIEPQLARDPKLVEQFSSKPQIPFKSTEKNEDKIFTFPTVSSVFHEVPHANSGYSSRLIDAIDVLDKALCKGLLNLMAEYYPFDDPGETKNISADYPCTSVLVNEYPQFYTIIQKHLEINDLVTMKPRISRPNLNIKSQTQKAADFIHLSICALLSCGKPINSEKLKELDSKFIKMLSDNIMDVDSCNVYLNNNQSRKKIDAFSQEERQKFDQFSPQLQVAILELVRKKDRHVAINLDPKYYHYFCRLNKERRLIFLKPQEAFKAFEVLSQESSSIWEKIISISSYVEFKKFINNMFDQLMMDVSNRKRVLPLFPPPDPKPWKDSCPVYCECIIDRAKPEKYSDIPFP